tara:strand:+ start:1414 stop:1623 length:210 start_codon:yes stop_codon:yes gene_type:complete
MRSGASIMIWALLTGGWILLLSTLIDMGGIPDDQVSIGVSIGTMALVILFSIGSVWVASNVDSFDDKKE